MLRIVVLLAFLALGTAGAALGTGSPGPGPLLGTPSTLVRVGPGLTEASQRQVVRTLGGRVYIVAVDDDRYFDAGQFARLRVYRADQTGIPTSFSEVDAADAPVVAGTGRERPNLGGVDVRLDGAGIIDIAFYRSQQGTAVLRTFSTVSDHWGREDTVATIAGVAGDPFIGLRGRAIDALTLDAAGRPLVAVTGPQGVIVYARTRPGVWKGTVLERSGQPTWHPSLVTDRHGRVDLAWEGPRGPEQIRFAQRGPKGRWGRVETVASGDVLGDSKLTNGQGSLVDQAPSVAVDSHDQPLVVYESVADTTRLSVRSRQGWRSDTSLPGVYSHSPDLYLRGDDRYLLLGHDVDIHPAYLTQRASPPAPWSAPTVFPPDATGDGTYDGSASSRFDPMFETDCSVLDAAFFDENSAVRNPGTFTPDLLYEAVRLSGPQSGSGRCRSILRRISHP